MIFHAKTIMPPLHSVEGLAYHSAARSAAHTDQREVVAYPTLASLPVELSASPSKLPVPRQSYVLVESESQMTLCHWLEAMLGFVGCTAKNACDRAL